MRIFLSAASAHTKRTGEQIKSLYYIIHSSLATRNIYTGISLPVETEDKRISIFAGNKDFHYNRIETKPKLQQRMATGSSSVMLLMFN